MQSQYCGEDLLPLQLCGHMLTTLSVIDQRSEEISPEAFGSKQLSTQHTLKDVRVRQGSR